MSLTSQFPNGKCTIYMVLRAICQKPTVVNNFRKNSGPTNCQHDVIDIIFYNVHGIQTCVSLSYDVRTLQHPTNDALTRKASV